MTGKGHPDWDEAVRELNALADSLERTGRPPNGVRVKILRVASSRPLPPRRIRKLRSAVTPSRSLFAHLLGVTPATVAAWETGTRKPGGMATRFLSEIESNPTHWRARLTELYQSEVSR